MSGASDSTLTSDADLFLFPAETEIDPARRAAWETCFQCWLAGYANPNTRRKYHRAVERCISTLQKPPWALTSSDIASYLQTGLGKARPNTQYFHLKALRAFYRHALSFTGKDGPLIDHNPAQGVPLPIPQLFLKSQVLEEDELRRLFAAIDREKPIGSRYYALYLIVLSAGLKATQALRLCIGDLKIDRGDAWIYVPGSSGSSKRLLRLPHCVTQAILTYLGLSGKTAHFQAGDPLFTPLEDMTGRLEKARKSNWDRLSLSDAKAGEYLHRYAGWAGLNKGCVTLESLRAAGALLRLDQGAGLQELACYLDLDNLPQAVRFLRQVLRQTAAQAWLEDTPVLSWLQEHGRYSRLKDFPSCEPQPVGLEERVDRFLREKILPPLGQPSRGKRRPACEPSLFTRSLWEVVSQPLDPKELEEARLVENPDDELALMRVLTRRLFEHLPDDARSDQYLKYLDQIGLMCIRIARISLIRYKMQGEPGPDFSSLLKLEMD